MRNLFVFSSFMLAVSSAFLITTEVEAASPCAGRKVTLTFNEGPDAITSPMVLETLKKNQVPATFFVLAKNFRLYNRDPAMKNFIDEVDKNELFSLGNTPDSGIRNLPELSRDAVAREINALKKIPRYQEIVKKQKNEFVRPTLGVTGPKGSHRCSGSYVCDEIRKAGYQGYVDRHADSQDWNSWAITPEAYIYRGELSNPLQTPPCLRDEEMKQKLCKCDFCQTRLLDLTMHNLHSACEDYPREEPIVLTFSDNLKLTADTLPAIIEAMKAEGVQFAPLDEIRNGNNSAWKKVPVPAINEDQGTPAHHSSSDEGRNHD